VDTPRAAEAGLQLGRHATTHAKTRLLRLQHGAASDGWAGWGGACQCGTEQRQQAKQPCRRDPRIHAHKDSLTAEVDLIACPHSNLQPGCVLSTEYPGVGAGGGGAVSVRGLGPA
jgi:hypothetical protein